MKNPVDMLCMGCINKEGKWYQVSTNNLMYHVIFLIFKMQTYCI